MNPIFDEFSRDLEKLERMFEISELLRSFHAIFGQNNNIQNHNLHESLNRLNDLVINSHQDLPILNGVILLYLGGRFEYFVRQLFEDLCDSLALELQDFKKLPSPMKENLVRFTAEVISNPRKYGHAEQGVKGFIKTLSDNLSDQPLNSVNSMCLSITNENMWPDTVSELFGRIGGTKIWEKLGSQARIQLFFGVDQQEKATKEAKSSLRELMELRNKIAHPSGAITWPSMAECKKFLKYCRELGHAMTEICDVWSKTLGTRDNTPPISNDSDS
jgi:hypothetical protein